jgi:PAS domain S-box-containing protein
VTLKHLTILHLEDDPFDAELVARTISAGATGWKLQPAASKAEFLRHLHAQPVDLILSDYTIPGFDGISALKIAREVVPEVPFVFLSGTIGEERAVAAMRAGASDYILKDNLSRLIPCLKNALENHRIRKEHAQALQDLIASQNFVRRVAEAVPDVLFIFDLERHSPGYLSGGARSALGYSAAELRQLEKRFPEGFVHPDDYGTMREFAKSMRQVQDGEVREIDVRLKTGHMGWRWFRARTTVFGRTSSGEVSQVLGSLHDVTERRREREKIREQAALLDIAGDAILVLDLEQRIKYWNQGAGKVYGWSADEIGGRHIEVLEGEPGEAAAAFAETVKTGAWCGEINHRHKDGQAIIVQSRWSLVRDEREAPTSVLVINSDITEKKELQQCFLQAQRVESIGMLAGGMAHDLNNIMTPFLMGVEILRAQSRDAKVAKTLDAMERSARRGVELVQQVTRFARGRGNDRTLNDPAGLLQEVASMVKETFPASIQVKTCWENSLWAVHGDSTQIHQALLNLCVNARDAMEEGGTLSLEAENVTIDASYASMRPSACPGEYVCIRVGDTGCGIPPEHVTRIFAPFFTTKEAGKGTGLGLSTVRAILEGHGGFWELDSSPGRGTSFRIYFPARQEKRPDFRDTVHILPQGGGELILVIDGEATIGDIIAETLRTFGYRALTAGDGAEGVAMLARHAGEVRLIISDTSPGFLDCPALLSALQRVQPGIPVLLMSGNPEDPAVPGMERGALELLRKPFTAEELLTAARRVLEPAPGPG